MSQTTRLANSLKRPFADLSNDGSPQDGDEERRKVARINSAFVKTPNARDGVPPSQSGAPKKHTWKPDDQSPPVNYETASDSSASSSSKQQEVNEIIAEEDDSLFSTESIIDLLDDKPHYPSLDIFKQLAGGCDAMARDVWDILRDRESHYCFASAAPGPSASSEFSAKSFRAAADSKAKEPNVAVKLAEGWRRQHALNTDMRAMLLDWMIDVSEEYHLQRVTIHAAINYVDRYIALVRGVTKSYLQLLGVTALFVAAKVEEWEPPRAIDFVRQTDGAVTNETMLAFEQILISTLKWELHPISTPVWVATFLQIIAIETGVVLVEDAMCWPLKFEDEFSKAMALCDLAIVHSDSMDYRYSDIAAAAVVLTATSYDVREELKKITGKTMLELEGCISFLEELKPQVAKPRPGKDVHLQPYNNELHRLKLLASRVASERDK